MPAVMRMDQTDCGGSLFNVHHECTQPLRKYEPLIRVDIEGKPLAQRLLSQKPLIVQEQTKVELPKQVQSTPNELKRSFPTPTETKFEPKKKQPKAQSKITSFFNKS